MIVYKTASNPVIASSERFLDRSSLLKETKTTQAGEEIFFKRLQLVTFIRVNFSFYINRPTMFIFHNIFYKMSNLEHNISKIKWISSPQKLNLQSPFLKAKLLKPIGNDTVEYLAQTERGPLTLQIPNSSSYLMSNGDIYDDMCEMDILNEPEVLNNIVQRYKSDKIFTYIGPTLIIVNPYRWLPQYFSDEVMLSIRSKIIDGFEKGQKNEPHIYKIAGNAFKSMASTKKKQAIVISGESGAGKTQSTKYCMQLLTSLSHKQKHPIQAKILACNPILEAFGNSKTLRNDNSSRFGKYVQIYFGKDNTIIGANIHSYLLQKSRVVSISEGQRSFHIFYALIASGKKKLKLPSEYRYLSQSNCFKASNIDDRVYFDQIVEAMHNIGFSETEQERIWQLISCILQLGNLEFDDSIHKQNESKPCLITRKQSLIHLGKCLDIAEQQLEKILLFQKKQFLKEFTYSPYNKDKCERNIDTLSKAIYNSIFQFILHKIQLSLKTPSIQNASSINILDIFGFQNFLNNTFEQFCINFTNEKLLKLYNQYIFERQMEILKSDGLEKEISSINPPTNDQIIYVISGNLSLFSIINDFTMPQQFKDSDIINGFQTKLKSEHLAFDKINRNNFIIFHSQCKVTYSIDGFKQKNQDKVLPQITGIVNKFFINNNKEQVGKTILSKFSKEIESLMEELGSSKAHFIRCIKPNEKKVPQLIQENYVLAQIRYLGVFETIQIRKKTFPARWAYNQFIDQYGILFPEVKAHSNKAKTQSIMKNITKDSKQYLFGSQRVYMSSQIDNQLSKRLHILMKKKIQSAQKIMKSFRKYKFRKEVFVKLKILVKRIRLWKKIAKVYSLKIQKQNFILLKQFTKKKKQEEDKKNLLQTKKKLEEKTKNEGILKKKKKEKGLQNMSKISSKVLKRKFWNLLIDILIRESDKKVDINERVIMNEAFVEPYDRNHDTIIQKKQFNFNTSFLNEKSIYVPEKSDVVFQKQLSVPFYKKNPKLEKLLLILSDKYQHQINDEQNESYFSPNSEDSEFKVDDTPNEILNKIVSFTSKEFYKKILKKRTNFIGMSKNEDEILVAKNRAMSKSLTQISENDEMEALKIFKYLVKIGEQAKLQKVFKLIEDMMAEIQGTSPHVKNQVFLQIIKQSNSDAQLSSVRILQCLSVFLHIYTPDNDFIYAGLQFYYLKIKQKKFTQRENECVNYVFRRMIRKLQKQATIGYMPVKYQMIALMCRRKITVPVFFPVGDRIFMNIEPYQTFGDLKCRILNEFGIDYKRINPEYFGFFEVINYDNQQIDESPINENDLAWDVVSYWERAKSKYEQSGINPPNFFLMVKVRYAYECHLQDEETIEIFNAQCYFDYFIGRIRLPVQKMSGLSACIKLLKFRDRSLQQSLGAYPTWLRNQVSEQTLLQNLKNNIKNLVTEKLNELQIKFLFVSICSQSPLAMSMAIPTQQNIKMFLKPKKIYLADKSEIIESINIKDIKKWGVDEDKFMIQMKGQHKKTQIVYTEYSKICGSYLSKIPSLIKSQKEVLGQSILNGVK